MPEVPRGGAVRAVEGLPDVLWTGPRLPRYLIIVAPNQPALYEYLTRNFAGDPKVQVMLDRRRGERRQKVQPREPERRWGERRQRRGVGQDLRYGSVVIIRIEE